MTIHIFVGAGGVGKTSVTAASAVRGALDQGKCLVLTIDPALRLKTALNLRDGLSSPEKITLDAHSPRGELWATTLDIHASLDRMVRGDASAAQAESILNSPIYQLLASSIAGMQELMSIERIHQAAQDGFERLFVDTAPSRHAFEFLDKPEFFVELVSSPIVQLVGRSYKWWQGSLLEKASRKALELYTSVEKLIGFQLTRDILDFFAAFQTIAEKYAVRARKTLVLLRNPEITRFTIVSSPFQARRDAAYFCSELAKRSFFVDRLIVNRMWPALPQDRSRDLPEVLKRSAHWYEQVRAGQVQKWNEVNAGFSDRIPRIACVSELPPDLHGLPALHRMAQEL